MPTPIDGISPSLLACPIVTNPTCGSSLIPPPRRSAIPVSASIEGLADSRLERGRVARREAVQLWRDRLEALEDPSSIDEAAVDHRSHVGKVAPVPALELRERLRTGIVVVEGEMPLGRDEERTAFPAGRYRDEVGRGRQLDVHAKVVLDP